MELDGYSSTLQIGFEYQGEQHYEQCFNLPKNELQRRRRDDARKVLLCKENGVKLLVIPYTVERELIPTFVAKHLSSLLKHRYDASMVQIHELELFSPTKLQTMNEIAAVRGGICLSKTYVDSTTHLTWQCADGHTWKAIPSAIKQGTWCPICFGKMPPEMALAQMKAIGHSKGGTCLAEKYLNGESPMRFRCAEGHEWTTTPRRIRQGNWCELCSYKTRKLSSRHGIGKLQEVAKSRGGECITSVYTNVDSKYEWRCKQGHVWKASAYSVLTLGSWCRECRNLEASKSRSFLAGIVFTG